MNNIEDPKNDIEYDEEFEEVSEEGFDESEDEYSESEEYDEESEDESGIEDTIFTCSSCGTETDHEILKETAGDLLVKCLECGSIHHVKKEKEPKEIHVKTIISMEKESATGYVELLETERVHIGNLLVAEVNDEPLSVEVTSIEIDDKRVSSALATDIDTLWTRVVDNVVLKVSYHDGRRTIPLYLDYKGEEDIQVGAVYRIEGLRYRVTHIKLRNGAMMRKDGWKAYARKIKRVYAIKDRY